MTEGHLPFATFDNAIAKLRDAVVHEGDRVILAPTSKAVMLAFPLRKDT